jgi:hypothetical protein
MIMKIPYIKSYKVFIRIDMTKIKMFYMTKLNLEAIVF